MTAARSPSAPPSSAPSSSAAASAAATSSAGAAQPLPPGSLALEPGRPWPLGATVDARGVNFAVFSQHATAVTLVLFDDEGRRERARLALSEHTDGVWHGFLPGARAGLVYGWRVDGPHHPERGQRFDPSKLLLDPYARRLAGEFRWTDEHIEYGADNQRHVPRAVVVGPDDFDWGDDAPPAVPMADSVLYEVHVKGFTARHPDVPAALRGTYEGFVQPAPLAHLKALGVTAVNLLPVHQSISERPLVERGLVNYWGYNTLSFFAPDRRFARTDPIREFKTMVKALHAQGIEVILDVVFNHTCEGDHRGPVLSWKGFDNECYYHLRTGHPAYYENHTGTGNALNLRHPRVLQMVMDSLRWWVGELHVDGFRFDLAATLGRGPQGFDAHAAFFECVRQDPMLARVKMIAEPWDIGIGGYQVGRFPSGWTEWNDRYRDCTRAFWVRKAAYRGELASRIAGSSDAFRHDGRRPQASLNYVTSHDGFTLADLVSYDHRHNHANGEDNRDGHGDNHSWNCGAEGPTGLLAIRTVRGRLQRALLATLMLSQGVPMLLGGDELGRTQQGNNNAYCQDNPVSWYDWEAADGTMSAFVASLIALRKRLPALRRTRWLTGDEVAGTGRRDIVWLNRLGQEMSQRQWEESNRWTFGFVLGAATPDERDVLVVMNAESGDWTMPVPAGTWRPLIDTAHVDGRPVHAPGAEPGPVADYYRLAARTVAVFERID